MYDNAAKVMKYFYIAKLLTEILSKQTKTPLPTNKKSPK
jgi:hypothetical protein